MVSEFEKAIAERKNYTGASTESIYQPEKDYYHEMLRNPNRRHIYQPLYWLKTIGLPIPKIQEKITEIKFRR